MDNLLPDSYYTKKEETLSKAYALLHEKGQELGWFVEFGDGWGDEPVDYLYVKPPEEEEEPGYVKQARQEYFQDPEDLIKYSGYKKAIDRMSESRKKRRPPKELVSLAESLGLEYTGKNYFRLKLEPLSKTYPYLLVREYYHATPASRLSSIKQKGLSPSASPTTSGTPGIEGVFLGTSLDDLYQFVDSAIMGGKIPYAPERWAFLRIRPPLRGEMIEDPVTERPVFQSKIPSSQIEVVGIYNHKLGSLE